MKQWIRDTPCRLLTSLCFLVGVSPFSMMNHHHRIYQSRPFSLREQIIRKKYSRSSPTPTLLLRVIRDENNPDSSSYEFDDNDDDMYEKGKNNTTIASTRIRSQPDDMIGSHNYDDRAIKRDLVSFISSVADKSDHYFYSEHITPTSESYESLLDQWAPTSMQSKHHLTFPTEILTSENFSESTSLEESKEDTTFAIAANPNIQFAQNFISAAKRGPKKKRNHARSYNPNYAIRALKLCNVAVLLQLLEVKKRSMIMFACPASVISTYINTIKVRNTQMSLFATVGIVLMCTADSLSGVYPVRNLLHRVVNTSGCIFILIANHAMKRVQDKRT